MLQGSSRSGGRDRDRGRGEREPSPSPEPGASDHRSGRRGSSSSGGSGDGGRRRRDRGEESAAEAAAAAAAAEQSPEEEEDPGLQAPATDVEPDPFYEDVSDLFLRAKMTERSATFLDAKALVLEALEVHELGPAGHSERHKGIDWYAVRWKCFGTCLLVLVLMFLMYLTRASVRIINAQDGLLVASQLPVLPGSEAVVATGAAVDEMSLPAMAAASPEALRRVRDVTLVHKGTWHCLRIIRSMAIGANHVFLEAADGSAVRVRHGEAYLRLGTLGPEEPIQMDGWAYQDPTGVLEGQTVKPTALLDVVTEYAAPTLDA
eukprot:TRINITY_DN117092_c0_g1_i1.p1 TRINITY_DN117092_c0_g1~~TRINITY_DN117092_c0_g1_i1.p1  ORF type:complete len:319 (-),score=83.40 TRINITY_DN117092_c0_g1_i1:129-1085(-)